jgi:hypothetical protein
VFTITRHCSLSWTRRIQSMLSLPVSPRSILTLIFHLRLGLPNGFFRSGFPNYILHSNSTKITASERKSLYKIIIVTESIVQVAVQCHMHQKMMICSLAPQWTVWHRSKSLLFTARVINTTWLSLWNDRRHHT